MEKGFSISFTEYSSPTVAEAQGNLIVQNMTYELPAEIWKNITSLLDEDDICSLVVVSHRWHKIGVDARQCIFPNLAHLTKVWSENSVANCDWKKINEVISCENHGNHTTLTAINTSELKIRETILNLFRQLSHNELKLLGALSYGCTKPKKFEYLIFQIMYERDLELLRLGSTGKESCVVLMDRGGFKYEHIFFYDKDHLHHIAQLLAACGNFDVAIEIAYNQEFYDDHASLETLFEINKHVYSAARDLICKNISTDIGIELLEKTRTCRIYVDSPFLSCCKKLIEMDLVYKALRVANCIDPKYVQKQSSLKGGALQIVSKALVIKGDVNEAIRTASRIKFEPVRRKALWRIFNYAVNSLPSESRGAVLLELYRAIDNGEGAREHDCDLRERAKQIVSTFSKMGQLVRSDNHKHHEPSLKYVPPLSEVVEEMCVEAIAKALVSYSFDERIPK